MNPVVFVLRERCDLFFEHKGAVVAAGVVWILHWRQTSSFRLVLLCTKLDTTIQQVWKENS